MAETAPRDPKKQDVKNSLILNQKNHDQHLPPKNG